MAGSGGPYADHRKCVACSNCVPICPMAAIYADATVNRATVNLDECMECYSCHRGMSKEHLSPTVVRTIRGFLKLLRVRFRDIQRMTMALAGLPITFEKKNPVFSLISDPATGAIREEILNEKVLSAILELKTTLEHVPQVLRVVEDVAPTLDTIVSIGVATRCDPQGDNLLESLLKGDGYAVYRGKTNLGLGRRAALANT